MTNPELERRARERLGTTLNGKYRLDALIGLGGMAAVYRASHRNRAQLAVKMLHPEISLNLEICARFLREGYAANSVQHPGVVLVTDDDVAEDGSAFLVMELLDGASVEELVTRFSGKMPPALAIDITLQLLDVLAAAHAAGVVHRDIKPANLFVTRGGVLKVLDFGIARVLEGAGPGSSTAAGIPIGTPTYMAPEQALGRVTEIDARTDLWAAGATLFTLLSGVTVHDAPYAAETLVKAATSPARSLLTVLPDAPPLVAKVVDQALAFEPKDRWQSAEAMAAGLVLASEGIAQPVSAKSALASLFPPRRSSVPEPRSSESLTPEFAIAPTVSAPVVPTPVATAPSLADFTARDGGTGLPVSSSQPVRAPRPSRALWVLGALVVVVGALAGGGLFSWAHARHAANAPSAAASSSSDPGKTAAKPAAVIVIIPGSQNLTNEPLLDATLEPILESALKRTRRVYPYSGSSMRALFNELAAEPSANDDELARVVAEKKHVRVVVARPSIAADKAAFRVTVSVKEGASGREVVELAEGAANQEDIAPALGRLACKLHGMLGETPCVAGTEARVGVSTSIEADHRFMNGRFSLLAGRNEEAVAKLGRAITVDPSFAMAEGFLGVALSNLNRTAEAREHLRNAMAHRDGLSERESLELAGYYHLLLDELDQARDVYEETLRRWPVDMRARASLSIAVLRMGDLERGTELLRETLKEHPKLPNARVNLVVALVLQGNFVDADHELRTMLEYNSRPPEVIYTVGTVLALLDGDRERARVFVDKLREENSSGASIAKADWAMFEGRFQDAVTELKAGIAVDERARDASAADLKWVMLAEAYARVGDTSRAIEATSHAQSSNDLATMLRAARVLARAGRSDETAMLERIIVANPGMNAPVFARILDVEILADKHGTKEAIAKAAGVQWQGAGGWLARAGLGEAYFRAGALEEAERELSAANASRGASSMAFVDEVPTLHYGPPVRYWLARAKEALYRPDAVETYKAFLAMEPDAQGDLLVADAKRRIAR
jgi:eukaryotic-like serine/threonine-protein kinase